jgi:hypothetical protein
MSSLEFLDRTASDLCGRESYKAHNSAEDALIEACALRFAWSLAMFPCPSLRMSGVALERIAEQPERGQQLGCSGRRRPRL